MSLNLLVTAGQIPEGFCATTWQRTLNEFAKNLQVQVPETLGFGTFTFGPTEPSVDKRVYPWFKTTEDGNPDDIYVYVGGEWVGFGFSRPPSQGVWNARLTLAPGDPHPIADSTGSVVYLTPNNGNVITLYTGAKWKTVSISEMSLSAAGLLADTNYDVFAELSGSDVVLTWGPAWSGVATRSVDLAKIDGAYCSGTDDTKRYVGTIRTLSSVGQLSDTITKRFVYNHLGKENTVMFRQDPAVSWSYLTSAWRMFNNSVTNRVDFVIGLPTDVEFTLRTSGTFVGRSLTALGLDSTTVPDTLSSCVCGPGSGIAVYQMADSSIRRVLSSGYHYLTMLENGKGCSNRDIYSSDPAGFEMASYLTGKFLA